MSKDLKILIQAQLNMHQSFQTIEKQINALQNAINKKQLNLKVDVDTSGIKGLNASLQQTQKQQVKTQKAISTGSQLTGEGYKDLKTRISEINKEIEKFGQKAKYTLKTDGKNNIKSAVIEYNDAVGKAIRETMTWKKVYEKIPKIDKRTSLPVFSDNGKQEMQLTTKNIFTTTDKTYIDNIERGNKATAKLTETQRNLRLEISRLNQENLITNSSFTRLNNAVNSSRNIDQLKKLEGALNRVQEKSDSKNNLSIFQRKAEIDANTLLNTHGKTVDRAILNDYLQQVRSLTIATPQLGRQMQLLNLQFREISGKSRDASRGSLTLLEAFKTAMVNVFAV